MNDCIEQMISVKNVSVRYDMYLTNFFMTETFLTNKMNDLYRTNDIGQKCFGQKCRLFGRLFMTEIFLTNNFCSIQIM